MQQMDQMQEVETVSTDFATDEIMFEQQRHILTSDQGLRLKLVMQHNDITNK